MPFRDERGVLLVARASIIALGVPSDPARHTGQ
jgi:hypothetical protein